METEFLFLTIILTALAGAAAVIGAFIARLNRKAGFIGAPLRHGIIAFGGGALLSAIGLVLIPHGVENQPLWLAVSTFLLGGLVFLAVTYILKKRDTPISQFLALMLDFLPEAIVLGAIITMDLAQAIFLSVIIAAQNLPEGFNAYREMQKGGPKTERMALPLMGLACLIGIGAGLFGLYLCDAHDVSLGVIMTFCAGGILYLVFQDIIPESHEEECGLFPAYGGLLGFTVGLIGYGLTV